MNKKQTVRTDKRVPPRPTPEGRPSDADRLIQGLPLESGDIQPRPATRVN